jgi:hypothetical protein
MIIGQPGRRRLILDPGFGTEERLTVARIKGNASLPPAEVRPLGDQGLWLSSRVASITPRTHSEGAKEFQKTSRREVRRESLWGQDSTALLHRRLDDQNL